MSSAAEYVVTARSITGRPICAGGVAWGLTAKTLAVASAQLVDLWGQRRALDIRWPASWVAPDGSRPGFVEAVIPAELLELMAGTQEAAADQPATPAPATTEVIVAGQATETTDPAQQAGTPPLLDADAPPDPEPMEVIPAADVPVATTPYTDPRLGEGTSLLFGGLAEAIRAQGVRAAKSAIAQELGPGLTLERLIDSLAEEGAGGLWMSRPQRALARAADGRATGGKLAPTRPRGTPTLEAVAPLTPAENEYHFGTYHALTTIPDAETLSSIPLCIYIRSGVRSGKTLMSGMGVIKGALTCSVRRVPTEDEIAAGVVPDADGKVHALQPGESIKVVFVTPKAEQSKKAFDFVLGAFTRSPRLKKLITHQTIERLIIRRPCDGVLVEFVMVAASPRGNNVRSGWLAGAVFDEAAFFDDGDEAAVNLRDNVTAAISRLLPGAQVWLPSSPWADDGYWHNEIELARKRLAKDGVKPREALAFHSSSRRFNPALPKGQEETIADPMERQREYEAEPVNALSNAVFPEAILKLAINVERTVANGTMILDPIAGVPHYAGTDLAWRQNSSTLAIARNQMRKVGDKMVDVTELAYHVEFVPPKDHPLVPSEVIGEFGPTCQAYGCYSMRGDIIHADTAKEHLSKLPGLPVAYDDVMGTQERWSAWITRVRELMSEGRVDLPNDPRLLSQLKKLIGKRTAGGKYQLIMPKQGRAHGDIVVAVVHAIVQAADGSTRQFLYDTKYDAMLTGFDRMSAVGPDDDD